jgi:hypothetical protein
MRASASRDGREVIALDIGVKAGCRTEGEVHALLLRL